MSLISPWSEEGKIGNLHFIRGIIDRNIDVGDQPRPIRQEQYEIRQCNSESSLKNNVV